MLKVETQKKIVMIMGIQRSGGTTFLSSFLRDSSITALKQEQNSQVYRLTHLRPIDETLEYLMGLRGTVIMEPKSDSKFRAITDIFEEYSPFEVWMLWNYSDPVAVCIRYLLRYPHKNTPDKIDRFIGMWNTRNQRLLDALPRYGERIAIIKLEDVIQDPQTLILSMVYLTNSSIMIIFQYACRIIR